MSHFSVSPKQGYIESIYFKEIQLFIKLTFSDNFRPTEPDFECVFLETPTENMFLAQHSEIWTI